MRVLITGGAGFIGSAVVRRFVIERGADVLNVDKLTYAGTLASLRAVEGRSNYQFLQADICDRSTIAAAFSTFQPELVIHLAAESHVDRSITEAGAFVQTNVVGSYTILEAARTYWSGLAGPKKDRFRFVHVSTDEVFGSLGDTGLFSESTAYDPSSPYSASKAASDHLARAWHRTYGLPVLISNCSNNYGPYQFPEKLIPLTILNAMEGRPLPVYGKGDNIRDWLYVEDHVTALEAIASRGRPGETYNVGGHNEQRNIDVVRAICRFMDDLVAGARPHDTLIEFVVDRPGHDARYAIDSSKIRQELGWEPDHVFESGLKETVAWYLDNQWWWKPLQERYQRQRLGLHASAVTA